MKSVFRVCFVLFSTVIFAGCLITPHYYSAKTLKPGKKSFNFSANNIILGSYVDEINVSDETTITPQIGYSVGLPYRFEAGVQYIPPTLLEARLRWQINPAGFKFFDISLDGAYGKSSSYLEYFKYGCTISKDIGIFTPYAYYANNDVQHAESENDDSLAGFIEDIITEMFNISSDIGFGISIKLPHNTSLYPEINYQIYDNHFEEGIFSFGAALKHTF